MYIVYIATGNSLMTPKDASTKENIVFLMMIFDGLSD
jgi:hypothetical protein